MSKEASAEATVPNIRRKTRRKYSAEEKIRIVFEGIRGDHTVAELCRREGISENLYYRWSKDFLEAGKSRLVGDTKRDANSKQVKALRQENEQLKLLVAELALKNKVLTPALAGGAREKSLLGTDTTLDV
jgi:transposase